MRRFRGFELPQRGNRRRTHRFTPLFVHGDDNQLSHSLFCGYATVSECLRRIGNGSIVISQRMRQRDDSTIVFAARPHSAKSLRGECFYLLVRIVVQCLD